MFNHEQAWPNIYNMYLQHLRHLQQYSRNQNVRIFGVPETEKENLDIIFKIAKKLQIDLKRDEIDIGHQ